MKPATEENALSVVKQMNLQWPHLWGVWSVVVETRRVQKGNLVNLFTLRIITVSVLVQMTATLSVIATVLMVTTMSTMKTMTTMLS